MASTTIKIAPRIQERLKECVATSPVTIVVGPTGCGKSTQVPSFLLDALGGPILCTQPRRLAVVSVATRVAHERSTPLGGDQVGYHVGQANHSLANTQLVFTTAGILLEELRAQGVQALTKYKVVVLDECHERSCEQELCLALCKLYLQYPSKKQSSNKIRLVLMSATFDHARYKKYFAGILGDQTPIDTITLETANMVDALHQNVQTLYLEDIMTLLRNADQDNDNNTNNNNNNIFTGIRHSRFWQSMRTDPDEELNREDGGKSLSLDLLSFLRTLVLYLDQQEPLEGVFMIFAPTYRHLEQIYDMLVAANTCTSSSSAMPSWKVGVLHSSMDIEDCLQAMQPTSTTSTTRLQPKQRKILLASAIADSSVTIPGVTCVIDLCRALQVHWNASQMSHLAKTTWASQSICNQRQGRTGRTNPGKCFRLVTKGFFLQRLEQWEEPLLAMSSCRNEALKLLCSVSSSASSSTTSSSNSTTATTTDPIQILFHCLDPPPQAVVKDAFDYLQSIGACVALPQGGYNNKRGASLFVPTKMGELLAALPFAVEDSRIIVAGAQVGLLHETLALRAIMSHKPAPIVHHFGDAAINDANILCYYDQAPLGTPESVNMANLAAFLYWDITWNEYRKKAALEQFAHCTGSSPNLPEEYSDFVNTEMDSNKSCCNVWRWCPSLEETHTQWCRARGINPTSVRGVAELMDTALNVFYMSGLEPEWLRAANPTPIWRRFEDWKGRQMDDFVNATRDVLAMVYNFHGEKLLSKALMALSKDATTAINEMTTDYIRELASLSSKTPVQAPKKEVSQPTMACVHFLEGNCIFGKKCRLSHSPYAVRPPCRFFVKGTCMRGDKCIFSHEDPKQKTLGNPRKTNVSSDPLCSLAPLMASLELPDDITDWFDEHSHAMLLLGEGNFDFTRCLCTLGLGPLFASDKEAGSTRIGVTSILRLDATRLHLHDAVCGAVAGGMIDTFHWNFPFTGVEDHDGANESLIQGTFYSVLEVLRKVSLQRSDPLELTLAFALQGDQFSRWNVLRSAARTGWRLSAWGPFPHDDFPGYQPRRANGDVFPANSSRFYEFKIHARQLHTI